MLRCRVVAALKAHGHDAFGVGGGRRSHPLRHRDRVCDRLLHDHVDPGGEGIHDRVGVLVVRRADVHDIGPDRVQQGPVIRKARDVPTVLGRRPSLGLGVGHRHQFHVGHRVDGRQVDGGDVTAPDDGRSDRHEARESRSLTCCST